MEDTYLGRSEEVDGYGTEVVTEDTLRVSRCAGKVGSPARCRRCGASRPSRASRRSTRSPERVGLTRAAHHPRATVPGVLLRPRWLAGHLLAIVVVVGFVALGVWQLDRNQQKHDKIHAARAAYSAPAPDVLTGAPPAAGSRVEASGTYDRTHVVLLRDQIHNGNGGDDLLVPLRLADGSAVLVDRGWLESGAAANDTAAPPGTVVVRGLVQSSRALSAQDEVTTTAGRLSLPRVDLARIGRELPYRLRNVWILAQYQQPAPGAGDPALPQPPSPDQVNHMQYAIEWFAFALIPLIGWPIVLWRVARRGERPAVSP